MIIRNISTDYIRIDDLRSPLFAAAPLVLKPGVDVTIYNEDAEKSITLRYFIDNLMVQVIDNAIEPSTGTSTAQTFLSAGHKIQDEGVDLPKKDILNFVGTGITVLDTPTTTEVQIGAGGHIIADEGTPLPQQTTLNFTGAGVDVIDTGTTTEIQVTQGGHTIEEEGTPVPQRTTLDFVGPSITVTDTGTKTQVAVTSQTFTRDFLTVTSPIADHTIILSNTPVLNSESVSLNGLVLRPGVTSDYTLIGNIITLDVSVVLTVGDEIQIIYAY